MNSSLSRLPQNVAVEALRSIERNGREVKAAQRLSSLSGLVSYQIASADDFDLSGTITDAANFGEFRFLITFTGDGTQAHPIAVPHIAMYVDGNSEANRLPDRAMAGFDVWRNDAGTKTLACHTYGSVDPTYLEMEGQLRWIISGLVTGSVPYFIKAKAAASCRGALSVERVV